MLQSRWRGNKVVVEMPTSPNPEDDPSGLKAIATDISTKLISLGEDEETAMKFADDVLDRIVNATRKGIRESNLTLGDDPLVPRGRS